MRICQWGGLFLLNGKFGGKFDVCGRYIAGVGEGFNARCCGGFIGGGIGRIERVCEAEFIAIGALYEVEHDSAVAVVHHLGKFIEVFCAPFRDRVWEFGPAIWSG